MENTCKWIKGKPLTFELPCVASCNSTAIMHTSLMKYCPFCGKPIELVEAKPNVVPMSKRIH